MLGSGTGGAATATATATTAALLGQRLEAERLLHLARSRRSQRLVGEERRGRRQGLLRRSRRLGNEVERLPGRGTADAQQELVGRLPEVGVGKAAAEVGQRGGEAMTAAAMGINTLQHHLLPFGGGCPRAFPSWGHLFDCRSDLLFFYFDTQRDRNVEGGLDVVLGLDLDLPPFQFTSAKLKAILVGKWIKMKQKSLGGEMGKVKSLERSSMQPSS